MDAERGKLIPRTYVVNLEQRAKALEMEYRKRTANKPEPQPPTPEDLVRDMGMVSLADEEPEKHYLGSASGLQIARFVVKFAKESSNTRSIENIVPTEHEPARQQGRERRPSFPALSAVPNTGLPNRELTDSLVTEFIFNRGLS